MTCAQHGQRREDGLKSLLSLYKHGMRREMSPPPRSYHAEADAGGRIPLRTLD